MRWSTFVKRQAPQAITDDPVDVFEHGVTPTHRLTSPLHTLQRGERAPQSFGGILVRLPRRLSKLAARDAHGWVRGVPPVAVQEHPTRWGTHDEWERAYPRRGLGLPKPLPRRQPPRDATALLYGALQATLNRLGFDAASTLNAARQRALDGMRAELARVVDDTVPGAELGTVRIDEFGVVHGSVRMPPDPQRSIVIRCVVSKAEKP